MKINNKHYSVSNIFKTYCEVSSDCISNLTSCSFDRKIDYRLAKTAFKVNMKIIKRNKRLGFE